MRGRARAATRQAEHAVTIAWHVENLRRADKRFKPLGHYLARLKPKKPQSGTEVLAIMQGFAAAGVPVTIRKLKG